MNAEAFFDAARARPFGGHLTDGQTNGLNAILAAFDKFQTAIKDRRWKAYMLATAKWETGQTMLPVREIGEGRGKPYGTEFYGRGLVQLTWQANYRKAETELAKVGVKADLVHNPDLALEPDIAAAIMILGMIEGWFTGKKLSDYFSPHLDDWTGARWVINGQDHATTIAQYGLDFNSALVKAL